jgi:glucose-6-phosphate 1-dehydrogenase
VLPKNESFLTLAAVFHVTKGTVMNFLRATVMRYALLISIFHSSIVGMAGTCIIFGATGDLARRDLIPALYSLYKEHYFSNLAVIGAAIQPATAATILEDARSFIKDYDEEAWQAFSARMRYVQVDARKASDYHTLVQTINAVETAYNLPGNRLIYCATTCSLFAPITQHLIDTGIMQRRSQHDQSPWHRIVYEKPFGYDLSTAESLKQ